MAKIKKSSGGSGGKRGHSNMTHYTLTEEIKELTKGQRRREGEREIREALKRGE